MKAISVKVWMVCCWQLIAHNIHALNSQAQMEQIASNIAGNIARCGCPFSKAVPQGSFLDFMLFSIFINDSFVSLITPMTIQLFQLTKCSYHQKCPDKNCNCGSLIQN